MKHLLVAAAILLLASPVLAQPPEYGFDEDYLVRIGQGDLNQVEGTEPAGWTIAEYLRVTHDGNETVVPSVSTQGEVVSFGCPDCNATFIAEQNTYRIGADTAAGDLVFRLVRSIPASDAVAFDLAIYGGQEGRIVAFVPNGHHIDTGAEKLSGPLTCTTGECFIEEYRLDQDTHVAIIPGEATVAGPGDDDDGLLGEWGPALLGILVGIALWSYLVSRGVVQKRRRQEVQKAAHVEAAEAESQDVLAARKRVLMAGLKELEKAKMGKEIETEVYDRLKAELKRETVTVMRALDKE